ncbi:nucleoside phosphorylase domain-containing protein [Roridomyces roridus]|uniref:Nucleoside phosphorylase domain-containing protein n=1 Tax=Roridomyces roridus TaxID=1738132 RepID=A0AAD7BH77_9AGAR|nr:nucleoside phosphorylase domain-containing protein [Roridomyces roridus]
MKQTLTDANFPRTADLRVYHLGLRPGEVANRIVTVGSPSRARAISAHFDEQPKPFELASERGFLTITGRYKGVPISVISIGMGHPNVDFFVREVRECLSGDMLIVRLGSCGSLIDVPVGSVVVPKSSVAVERNLDFDFVNPQESTEKPYRISKPVLADPELHAQVHKSLAAAKPVDDGKPIVPSTTNASADSFYSSQGRQTSFPDQNENLIELLQESVNDLATFEMETFWLYHLAACWSGRKASSMNAHAPPLAAAPVQPTASQHSPAAKAPDSGSNALAGHETIIRAAAAQMVFASRTSQDFITPEDVAVLEEWTGKGVLDALAEMVIAPDRVHADQGTVWELA